MGDQQSNKKAHKQATQLLQKIIEQINTKMEDPNRLDSLVQILFNQLKEKHINVIIVLHHLNVLTTLLETLNKALKVSKSKKYDKLLDIICRLGFECLFSKNDKYLKLFHEIKQRYRGQDKIEYPELSQASRNRYFALSKLVTKFFQIKKSKQQSIPLLKNLQQCVNDQIKTKYPQNTFQECLLGWLKVEMYAMQKLVYDKLRITPNSLCCRFHFLKNEVFQYLQTTNIKFIPKVSKKFEYVQRIEFLKKVVVSYLNAFGGTIYFGIDDNIKKTTIVGVPVSPMQRLQFLKFLVEKLVFSIYPYDSELQDDSDKEIQKKCAHKLQDLQEQWSKKIQNQYILTEFISVEFINIHENPTLACARDQEDNILYVVKINVRAGNQYRLYHLINQKDTPETYICEGKKQKTYYFQDFCQQMYRRLKAEASNKKYDKGQSPVHEYCMSFRNTKQKKKEQ